MSKLKRILVLAKPTLGRSLETILRGADYEVHRIPDARLLDITVTRLRPHVVITSLPPASAEGFAGVSTYAERASGASTSSGECGLGSRMRGTPVPAIASRTSTNLGDNSTSP